MKHQVAELEGPPLNVAVSRDVVVPQQHLKFEVHAARIENPGHDYRLARTASGDLVLQRAWQWHQGSSYGFEWRTEPIVQLGEDGKAP